MLAELIQVSDYWLCNLKNSGEELSQTKPKIKIYLVIDNSGSMGRATQEVTEIIGQGLFGLPADKIKMEPGVIFLFSEKVELISDKIEKSSDLDYIRYPRQGMTNITGAIQKSIEHILANDDPAIHYVMAFLSDGQHNSGPELNTQLIQRMRKQLDAKEIRLSTIIVGVTSNSNTSLGMRIKSGLETVPMNTLQSIYYAKNVREMNEVLSELNTGCVTSLSNGISLDLSLKDGIFFETMTKKMSVFMYDKQTSFIIKGNKQPQIVIDGRGIDGHGLGPNHTIEQITRDPSEADITRVIDAILPKLSQRRIAHGPESIKKEIAELEKLIDLAERIFTQLKKKRESQDELATVEQIGQIKIKPSQRLQMIKSVRQSQNQFHQERNKLRSLLVSIENDSSKQAQFLTGINKKYSSKAVLRAGTIEKTVSEVIDDFQKVLPKLKAALDVDKKNSSSSGGSDSVSILSLNTALEQFEEWLGVPDFDYPDLYSILLAFGFYGYSVKFQHNNAVQMDPFQTSCLYIEPCPIDSNSILLSNQLGKKIQSPSRTDITDCLVLVDPTCPQTSVAAMKLSPIYQYLSSITLCRDLYMYHPKMTFSMHAHALLKSMNEYGRTKSTAYLDLALRILYSIRKYWGDYAKAGENVDLFKHWWVDWDTITQSEKDNCNHPIQLLLMLGAYDFKELAIQESTSTPNNPNSENNPALINLLSEVMARTMKMILASLDANVDGAEENMRNRAIGLMQRLFGITPENSPKPDPDIMVQEPTIESIRESCESWAEIDPNSGVSKELGIPSDITAFLNQVLSPYILTYHLGILMQGYLSSQHLSWDDLCHRVEEQASIPEDLLTDLGQKMGMVINYSVWDYLGLDEKKIPSVAQCLFLQATLKHNSASRTNINEKSFLDSDTLRELIVDLRIAHYQEASKEKRQQWLDVIGDVTYADALTCDEFAFAQMIGKHTHGHNKQVFWALLKASANNAVKKQIFLDKSSSTASVCFGKI